MKGRADMSMGIVTLSHSLMAEAMAKNQPHCALKVRQASSAQETKLIRFLVQRYSVFLVKKIILSKILSNFFAAH